VVDSLVEEDIHGGGRDLAYNGESNRCEVGREERRPVVEGGIDPSEEEVVVSIWVAFSGEEELLSSSLVELCSGSSIEWHVDYVEVNILSHLDPVSELVSLDVVHRPVPGIL